ncbi:hypothetical protein [uncultured Gammaproteobacteria bacterium]|nr:hypothetical protein [uncultured Gammaproteobacteria bacterium]CAC9966256.1 hypothetical protein [uncultured Gammaproteobacteria bacterium]CAC9988184.1 hypothetical protein [uncultured Gammaproteobacteria bacterium]
MLITATAPMIVQKFIDFSNSKTSYMYWILIIIRKYFPSMLYQSKNHVKVDMDRYYNEKNIYFYVNVDTGD